MYGVRRGMARQGYGADVVSGGELERALAAGMAAEDIVFSGVGTTRAALAQGLDRGIGQFNIEHEPEGIALAQIAARQDLTAPALLRGTPDVNAGHQAKNSSGQDQNTFDLDTHRMDTA